MPRIPVSQHHRTAPGPPSATAVDMPMIFPVPSVAARVVMSAEKPLIPFWEAALDVSFGLDEVFDVFFVLEEILAVSGVKQRWIP